MALATTTAGFRYSLSRRAGTRASQVGVVPVGVVIAGVVLAASLAAQTASADTSVKAVAPKTWPIGGMVTLSSAAGIGTFVAGEQNRPSVSGSLNLLLNYRPMPGLTLMLSQTINKTFVDYAEDSFAPRARNSNMDDLLLIASWSPMVKGDDGPKVELSEAKKKALAAAAAINPTLVTTAGAGKPLTLPGDIRVSFLGLAALPTSRASTFQTRWLSLTGAVNFSRTFGKVSLTYQPRIQKQFHQYSTPVVSYDPGAPLALAREGGAEAVGDSLVAIGQQNISFQVRNALIANIAATEALSFQVFYFLAHQYRYYDAPLDEFSSPHAKAGRGRLDLQFGSLAANYVLPANWVASLGVSTFSQPWSADNATLRFPFFDFRSASDNISSVSLSFTRMF